MTVQNNGANFLQPFFFIVNATLLLVNRGQIHFPNSLIFIRAEYRIFSIGIEMIEVASVGCVSRLFEGDVGTGTCRRRVGWHPRWDSIGLTCCYWLMKCRLGVMCHHETIPHLLNRYPLSNN